MDQEKDYDRVLELAYKQIKKIKNEQKPNCDS